MKKFLLIVLVLVFIADLCAIGLNLGHDWRFVTKTLLIPILIVYYILNVNKPNKLFLFGLVMSFFGDLFLLFKGGFIPGLSSFLIAHILYILTFKPFFLQKNFVLIPIITIFIFSLCGFLYQHLGAMKIPVILYAVTIGTMLYIAVGTRQKWLIIGALLFVISDAILAINLFYKNSTLGGMSVMLTYVIAQYCLIEGMIKENKLIS